MLLQWHGILTSVPLLAPGLYLVLALGLIPMAGRLARQGNAFAEGALVMAIASASYALSFTLLGIAALARYQFFTLLAALLALVLYICARRGFVGLSRGERALIAIEGVLLLVIIISRVAL
ncbi:hypothetical protein [Sphingomonas montanisoli]|uniref:Uncharacterized protein n=1 Tax=Sphingomonas montanisoli TaxID=2606412 RepID=A0A5D9CFQ0_9SPHN|nr:hypothetical protein [Sphingomonas montanisoli]TZG28971.1 hypothetical protein FYJ91_02170 [Sphingomonas montanisoli]